MNKETFGYGREAVPNKNFAATNFVPAEGLLQPDPTSIIWIGGVNDNSQTLSCKCQMALVRFYKDLFVNSAMLMDKFQDYSIGNQSSLISYLMIFCIIQNPWSFSTSHPSVPIPRILLLIEQK